MTLDEENLGQLRDKASVGYEMVREDLGDELVDQMLAAVEAARE